jgi:hypothetical protein
LLLLLDASVNAWATRQLTGDGLDKTANSFEFRPGVIVDPDRPAVYLMKPQGGIDAVDLSSGKLVWTTTQAAKPLLLYGNLLVAQAEVSGRSGVLRIVGLNTKDGGKIGPHADVELPEGVSASIEDGLGTSFRASARIHEGALIVSWLFSEQPISGAYLGADATAPRQVTGVARIELETGRVDPLASDKAPPPNGRQLPDNIARLVESGALPGRLWRVGNILVTPARIRDKDGERIILKRWDGETGETLPEITFFSNGLTIRYPSADNRHLLMSKLVETDPQVKYLWVIFSLETGTRVAEVRNFEPAAWFFISGSSLIHEVQPQSRLVKGVGIEEPRKLRAINLESGAELWNWPIRDTAYRGSYPPVVPGSRGTPAPR